MAAPMLSEQWAEILEPGLKAVFFQQFMGVVGGPGVTGLYNNTTSGKATETTLGVGGLADVPVYNGTINYDSFDEQYAKTFTHVEYADGISVARKLVADDQYNIINQRTSMLANAFARTQRKHRTQPFNTAFSTTTTADAVALCSGSHPTSKQRGGTQSNAGTSPLTHDSVIATRKLMLAFEDDRGELVNTMPDTLVVPIDLEDTAWVIVNSMNKSGTANNDGNFNRDLGWNVVVDRYLTDSNNWFMVDSAMARMHLWWFTREPLEFMLDPSSAYDLVARYRGYTRYSFGADDWRWIYGHDVS